MSLVRDAKTLNNKAICSLRIAMTTFNSYDDNGRVTSLLLHLQHATEMLLKAVLCQNKHNVFDKKTGKSIGFKNCVALCQSKFNLGDSEAGIFRSINTLRDAAQHWFIIIPEDFLYLQTRAMITAFDIYMKQALNIDLSSNIPQRVLPVSTKPIGNFDVLIDKEFKFIYDLLRPGKRKRNEARARIRSMLAMESIVTDEVEISQTDINRIERAIKTGHNLSEVFPRLNTIDSALEGEGTTISVKFSKKEGAPIRFTSGDDPQGAAAVREIDLQRKFHLSATDLAKRLKLTAPKSCALRRHLKIDNDNSCKHTFMFRKTKFHYFSDNALNRMKTALNAGVDMDHVWRDYRHS